MKAVGTISGAQPYQAFKDALEKLMSPPKPEEDEDQRIGSGQSGQLL